LGVRAVNTIEAFGIPEPVRPYNPDNCDVLLGTKIARHLRRKGWKQVTVRGEKVWEDKKDRSTHSFTAAVRIQLHREGYKDV